MRKLVVAVTVGVLAVAPAASAKVKPLTKRQALTAATIGAQRAGEQVDDGSCDVYSRLHADCYLGLDRGCILYVTVRKTAKSYFYRLDYATRTHHHWVHACERG
jgi:hypothetical protein